jgi:hypothetical protein
MFIRPAFLPHPGVEISLGQTYRIALLATSRAVKRSMAWTECSGSPDEAAITCLRDDECVVSCYGWLSSNVRGLLQLTEAPSSREANDSVKPSRWWCRTSVIKAINCLVSKMRWKHVHARQEARQNKWCHIEFRRVSRSALSETWCCH